VLPWDVIDSGVDRKFLVREHRRALEGKTTPDCRFAGCRGCGICSAFGVSPRLAAHSEALSW
ncbi:MAG: hypothetical protein ACPLTR_02560, partial [Thermacetogeniaceae bacterium]